MRGINAHKKELEKQSCKNSDSIKAVRPKNKYIVWGEIAASLYIGEFSAHSPEEAEQMAYRSSNMQIPLLCDSCKSKVIAPRIDFLTIEKIAKSSRNKNKRQS